MRVRIYVEGGGNSRSLHIQCREGFRKLLERAGFALRMPSIKACGSRNDAYDDFKTALRINATIYPILLVDSEGPVNQPAWAHLRTRDGWAKPDSADDDQAQLMVQCMETWCIADREALRRFFDQCLQEGALPVNANLEAVSKDDAQETLAAATAGCGRHKVYDKGTRSFELLGTLAPARLREALPHFRALCEVLEARL